MKTPISWLKEYVDIKLPLKDLMWRMTEVGMTTESYEEIKDDYILDVEVTPNRPDWMSIIGIARELSAIQSVPLKYPEISDLPSKKADLPFKINNDFKLCPRHTAITIKGVSQKPSPDWLQEKLIKVGLRPINNLVDITNFVMFELGNPIHVFDYDKLINGEMTIMKSKGGERFISVDEKAYTLPKDAIIFKSGGEVIDLCGIKGGLNSGITAETKNILIHVVVYNGQLIRRTSQILSLWSEASRIFERGVNAGGTIDSLKRTAELMLDLAGGTVASKMIDIKTEDFKPWKLELRLDRLAFMLGIDIPDKKVMEILNSLNLSPEFYPYRTEGQNQKNSDRKIRCTIPTYRGDLKIEEDLIEEVARLYGYNNFPKTLPAGQIPTQTIPYFKNYDFDKKLKNILTSAGFSEIQTYSLISEKDLLSIGIDSEQVLRIDNPVSREYEYLRPTLKQNLIKGLQQNKPFYNEINLFEIGKIYLGNSLASYQEEYQVAGITNEKSFYEVKGILEKIFSEFRVNADPVDFIEQTENGYYFAFPYKLIYEQPLTFKPFIPLPKFPSLIEDMAFIIPEDTLVGEIITVIKKQSILVKDVQLFDKYQNVRTFRITYQDPGRNLTSSDIEPIREKIIKTLKVKNIRPKL